MWLCLQLEEATRDCLDPGASLGRLSLCSVPSDIRDSIPRMVVEGRLGALCPVCYGGQALSFLTTGGVPSGLETMVI